MILVLHADGHCTLEDAGNFQRFHCEIDPLSADPADALETARAAFEAFGELESAEVGWVDRAALTALGLRSAEAADGAAPDWRAQVDAMLDKAARYGWIRGHEPSIKSHIVWRSAGATPSSLESSP